MNYISLNIKYLFEKQNLSEVDFGKLFGLGRGAIQSYIANKATPKIETIQKMTVRFGLSIDEFVNSEIGKQADLKRLVPEESINQTTENFTFYSCPECINKQKEIDTWKSKFYALCDESREVERKYRELLEGKIVKKESAHASDAQAG